MSQKYALLSVSDKTGITEIARSLAEHDYILLSTGGTAKLLREQGLEVTDVSSHTGFPEMMDGRVKTLHPKIHGGLLGVRKDAAHMAAMEEHSIAPIDVVILTLYPFEKTVTSGASPADIIEQIDIGGPSMLRSAAKNHASVTVVTNPDDYQDLSDELKFNGGKTTTLFRQSMAAKAFALSASYDSAIANWFASQQQTTLPEKLHISGRKQGDLHYGENPHQEAAFYEVTGCGTGVMQAEQIQGKPLSYNNVNDTDAALGCIREFDEPACVIVKHANPCGVGVADNLVSAYHGAFACDTVSAYGGIIAVNREVDAVFAEALSGLFVEVLIAPSVTLDAKSVLANKKKMRLLVLPDLGESPSKRLLAKSVSGGILVQTEDHLTINESELKTATRRAPTEAQMADLKLAFIVAKHVKSNAIVFAKNGATMGIGAGQMSRIDSTNIARLKAAALNLDLKGAAMASDAFFPFPDNVELAAECGVASIIQPGGSIRDGEVIDAANEHDIAMVFTGIRHFKH